MARAPRHYEPDQPSLFTEEMLGEQPVVSAPVIDPDPLPEEPFEPLTPDTAHRPDPIYFISFGSGSSGNCSYIGDKRSGFLIDAGIEGKYVEDTLMSHGISMERVRGICLTHDHGDHVRYIYSIIRAHRHLKIYCTPKVLNGILRRHSISRRIKDYHRAIYKEFEFGIGNFTLTPFEVLHDGTDNCGFFISHGDTKMAVATDLGCISPRVEHYMSQADFVVLESNYDREMLINGHYHDHLKARIIADHGHLDNVDSAKFLANIYRPEMRYAFLCHLSQDNNTPELTEQTHRRILAEAHPELTIGDGTQENVTELQLVPLPRSQATPLYALRKK